MAPLPAAEIASYRAWLRDRWSVDLEGDPFEHAAYDPRVPLPDPATALGIEEERDPARGLSSDQATFFVAGSLRGEGAQLRGRTVWEVGCGTGVLSALAGKLGARRVLATDVDAEAVALARRTGERNGVAIETAVASLFEGAPWSEPVDVLIADLPQKPVSGGSLPLGQDGGPDGSRWLLPFLEGARSRLKEDGRLYFFCHSLTHPQALQALHRLYRPRLLSTMWRIFERDCYSSVFTYLEKRRNEGLLRFWNLPDGRFAFLAMNFAATPR